MNVYDYAHSLSRALKQHPDVVAMKAARQKVDQDPQSKQMLEDFMAKAMQLQMMGLSGREPSAEEQAQLEKLSEIVHLHSDIREFRELGMRVERILQDVYKIIVQAVETDEV